MKNIQVQAKGYPKVIEGKVTMISLDVLDVIWPQVVPILEKAEKWFVEYYTIEDVLECCRCGDLQLWVAVDEKRKIFAVGCTSIVEFPRCRVLRCALLAGRGVKEVLACLREIEDWAAMLGCTRSEIVGRLPFRRLTAPIGYTERGVMMVKTIASTASDRRH